MPASLVHTSEIKAAIQDPLSRAIKTVIEEEIDRVVKEATATLEQRIRGQVGNIAARVLERFSYERLGNDLVIRVEFPKGV